MVQHMALGVAGMGCEDALTHLLNYVWPNIFETSPHVVNAVQGAVDGCRLALGPAIILNYLLQVPSCLHPPMACHAALYSPSTASAMSAVKRCHLLWPFSIYHAAAFARPVLQNKQHVGLGWSRGGEWNFEYSAGMQGLFHPARKVREVYWRLYNNLYIGAQDALVGCYPKLEDDGINTYNRQELDVFF